MSDVGEVILGIAASVLILLWLSITRPIVVKCPHGWRNYDGVRRTGDFSCAPAMTGSGENDEPESPWRLQLRVYCTGGSEPIVVSERVVGCQRR